MLYIENPKEYKGKTIRVNITYAEQEGYKINNGNSA